MKRDPIVWCYLAVMLAGLAFIAGAAGAFHSSDPASVEVATPCASTYPCGSAPELTSDAPLSDGWSCPNSATDERGRAWYYCLNEKTGEDYLDASPVSAASLRDYQANEAQRARDAANDCRAMREGQVSQTGIICTGAYSPGVISTTGAVTTARNPPLKCDDGYEPVWRLNGGAFISEGCAQDFKKPQ